MSAVNKWPGNYNFRFKDIGQSSGGNNYIFFRTDCCRFSNTYTDKLQGHIIFLLHILQDAKRTNNRKSRNKERIHSFVKCKNA